MGKQRNPNFTTKRQRIQRNKEKEMMKNSSAQTIFASVRRGFSSIADSSVSPRAKHVWKEQDKFVLGLAFVGGWFGKAAISKVLRIHVCMSCNYVLFLVPIFQILTREESIA